MKKRRKSIAFLIWMILICAVCIINYSWYKLYEIQQIYSQGDESYEELTKSVRHMSALPQTTSPSIPEESLGLTEIKSLDIPNLFIDFEALSEINPDTAAWLYSPDTPIDYPVMRAEDYDKYLHLSPYGKYNVNGSLFLDYNCDQDFSDRLTIIYGHNMKSGKMFGSLVEYNKQEYFEKHPFMYLYTENGNYRIDLKYGCVIGAGQWRERAFMYDINLNAMLSYAESNTTFQSNATYSDNDKFIVFSTCSYEFDDARYVLVGILRPENDT